MSFKNQTDKVCPICADPIFTDADLAEFRSAPGIVMHSACLEAVGGDRALAIVAGVLEGEISIGRPSRGRTYGESLAGMTDRPINPTVCDYCNGTGIGHGPQGSNCPKCEGRKYV